MAKFLQSSFTELQPQGPCAVWNGWQGAVAALGLTELTPLMREAFERDFVDQSHLDFEEFEADLERVRAGDPLETQQPGSGKKLKNASSTSSAWSRQRP